MCAAMVERDLGASGLNSFSDDRYNENQRQQRMVLNQNYNDLMQQPPSGGFTNVPPAFHGGPQPDQSRPVYYRVGTPEKSLPLGLYSDRRKVYDQQRQQEYNILLNEKREQENRRQENLYGRRGPAPENDKGSAPEKAELYDYKQQQQHHNEDKRRAYQEFLGPGSMPSPLKMDSSKKDSATKQQLFAKEKKREYEDFLIKEQINRDHKREIRQSQRTPPQTGFPFDKYQTYQQKMKDKRKAEFEEYMVEQQKDSHAVNPHFKKQAEKRRWDLEGPVSKGGFEFGNYENYRKELKEKRKQEFLEYKHEKEKRKKEEQAHERKPITPPGGLDIGHYDLQRKQNRQALIDIYRQDLDKQKHEQLLHKVQELQRDSSPVFMGHFESERPLVGMSPRERELRQVLLGEEKRKEYNDFLMQKEEKSSKREPTPPVGLNILTQEDRKRRDKARQKIYGEELLRQQQEQMLSKAQLQMDVPVYDKRSNGSPQRTSQPPMDTKPPPQEYDRMPPSDYDRRPLDYDRGPPPGAYGSRDGHRNKPSENRQTPAYWDDGKQVSSPAQSVDANTKPLYPPDDSVNKASNIKHVQPRTSMEQQITNDHAYEERKQQLLRDIGGDKEARDRQYRDTLDWDRDARDRNAQDFHRLDEQLRDKNLMDYIEKKRIEEDRQFNNPRKKKLEAIAGRSEENYDPERYENMKHKLQDETHKEYKRELAKPVRKVEYGLPIGQWRYDPIIKERQNERNKDYNEFLKSEQLEVTPEGYKSLEELFSRQDKYEDIQMLQERQRNKEYNEILDKTGSKSQREVTPKGYTALPVGQDGFYAEKAKLQEIVRNREYNEMLKQGRSSRREATPVQLQALPIDQTSYKERLKVQAKQRNKEYNGFLDQTGRSSTRELTPQGYQGLPLGSSGYEEQLKLQEIQRNMEYNQLLEKTGKVTEREMSPKGYTGLPIGQDNHEERVKLQEMQRNKAYNEMLKKTQADLSLPRKTTPDELKGLPVTKRQDEYKTHLKLQEKQRNKEYNEILQKAGNETRIENTPKGYTRLPVGQDNNEEIERAKEMQRNREYNQMLEKNKNLSKRETTPDGAYGLPIGQNKRDALARLHEIERNKEYNHILEKKDQTPRNDFSTALENTGLPVGHPHSEEIEKLKEKQRNKEYNDVQEKTGRISLRKVTPNGRFGLPIGQHNYEAMAKMKEKVRNKEYNDLLKQTSKDPANVDFTDPSLLSLPLDNSSYEARKMFMEQERNQEYNDLLVKKVEPKFKRMMRRMAMSEPSSRLRNPTMAPDSNTSDIRDEPRLTYSAQPEPRIPISKGFDFNVQKIIPTGDKIFEGIHKAIQEDYLQDFRDYSQKHYQNIKEKPKDFWKTERLQIVPTSGEYSKRTQRFKEQLRRDFQEIQNQKEPPRERNKDFGEKGLVLLKDPSKDFATRHKQADEEYKQEFQDYINEKNRHPDNPKRNLSKRPDSGKDPAKNPSKQIGFMAYLGAKEHDKKQRLGEDRNRDYNEHLKEASWYNQEMAPVGLASPNKDDFRQPRERIGSYNHRDYVRDSPTYKEMLESKRRHEAAYRRYDDPELNRYPQTSGSDPGNHYSPGRYQYDAYGDRNRY